MTTQTRKKLPGNDGKSRGQAITERDIVEDYADLLNELRLLTTVSVLLFGFLMTVARQGELTKAEQWLLLGAMIAVASATVQFVLPIVYHRAQFPYDDWDKFQLRVHGFIRMGLPMLGLGFYLSLALAAWVQFDEMAFAIALVPVLVAGITFAGRRIFAKKPQ